jgi:short-subunit dehydrogenase involved in D-alanine esterification of teichoic acids
VHNYLKVKGNTDLVRDASSGVILNLSSEYAEYEARVKANEAKNTELNTLRNEVEELKGLVMSLLEMNKGN